MNQAFRPPTQTLHGVAALDGSPRCETAGPDCDSALRDHSLNPARFDAWATGYREPLRAEHSVDAQRRVSMSAVNPKYVLRNYLAKAAIRKAADQRDYSEITRLHEVPGRPFENSRSTRPTPHPQRIGRPASRSVAAHDRAWATARRPAESVADNAAYKPHERQLHRSPASPHHLTK